MQFFPGERERERPREKKRMNQKPWVLSQKYHSKTIKLVFIVGILNKKTCDINHSNIML